MILQLQRTKTKERKPNQIPHANAKSEMQGSMCGRGCSRLWACQIHHSKSMETGGCMQMCEDWSIMKEACRRISAFEPDLRQDGS